MTGGDNDGYIFGIVSIRDNAHRSYLSVLYDSQR